jgi:hypothetical protein
MYSLAVVFIACGLADILGQQLFNTIVPQVTPVMILIPVGVIFYSIKKYDAMKPKTVSEENALLGGTARTRVYNYVSIGFIVGGFINFISQYLVFHDNLGFVLINSSVIICFGIASYTVQHLKVKQNTKDIFNIAVLTVAIPVITLRFSQYAGLTIWALPFAIVIIALTFNKRTMLAAVAAAMVLTEVYLWAAFPNEPVFIDGGNYIGRIGIFIVTTWIAAYVNRVYSLRMKENAEQIKFQTMVSEISADFLNITQSNLNESFNNMLRKSGMFFGADRAYAFLMGEDSKIDRMHSWPREDVQIGRRVYDPLGEFPWWREQIIAGRAIYIPDTRALPGEASKEKA